MADLATITIPVDSSAMVRAVKDAKSLEGSIKLLAKALDSGVIGQKQFDAGLAQLEKQFKNLFKSADGAASSILRYVQSLRESKSATEAAAAAKDKLAMATKKAETAFALANQKAEEELRTLKNRVEFAFAMAMQKEQEVKAAQEAARANQELINSLTGYKTAYASAENSAESFTNELRKQEAQALETARANQEAINKQFGIGQAPATSKGAGFGAIEGEILRLEATYNKVALAARVYEQAEKSLNKAVLMGVLTADQKEAKLMELSMAYQKVGQDADKAQAFVNRFGENAQVSGRGLNRFGMIAQQVGYQVGDFFVQIQSGTNVLVAFGQQATQLAGLIPGVWGAAIGIGISLATAIGAAFMRMGEAAEDSADKIDTQKQAFDALTESIRQSRLERQMEGSGLDETQQNATNELVKLQANLNVLLIEQTELQKAAFDSAVTMTTAEQAANEAAIASTRVAIAEAERKLALDKEQKRLVQEIKDIKAGDEETRALQQEIALIREKLKYGEDSVQVKALETQQTLENYEAELRRTIVNEDIIAQLVAQKAETIAAGAELENTTASAENLENALKAAASAMAQLSGFSAGLDVKISQAAAKVDALKRGANAANAAMVAGLRAEAEQRRDNAARVAVGAGQLRQINAEYADSIKKIEKLDTLNATFEQMSESQKKAAGGSKKLKEELTAAEKAAKEFSDTMDGYVVGAVDGVANAFADFVVRGFKDFKGFVKSVIDSFKNMIAQMIAIAVKNKILISLGFASAGAGGAGVVMNSGFGTSGLGGVLGSFAGAGGAAGTGLLGGFGAAMPSFLGGAGNGLFAVGANAAAAGGGIAATIGAVAAPLLAVAAVFSFFKKKTKELDNGLKITINNMDTLVESFRTVQTSRFWGLSKKVSTNLEAASDEVANPIIKAVADMQKGVVDAAKGIGIAAVDFSNFSHEMQLSLKGLTDEQAAQKVQEELAKLGDAMAETALKGAVFSEYTNKLGDLQNQYFVEQLMSEEEFLAERQRLNEYYQDGYRDFSLEGETALQTLNRLSTSLTTANQMFYRFGMVLQEVSLAGAHTTDVLIRAFGGLDQFNSAFDYFFNNFLSGQEQLDIYNRQLNDTFASLGLQVPTTIEAFKQLVFTLQATAAGVGGAAEVAARQLASIMSVADVFKSSVDLVAQLQKTTTSTGKVTRSSLGSSGRSSAASTASTVDTVAEERLRLERQLLEVQGKTAEIRELELGALDASNRAIQTQIWLLEDQAAIAEERNNLEEQILQLQGKTQELRNRELAALNPVNRSLQEMVWKLEDAKAALDGINEQDFSTLVDFQRAVAVQRSILNSIELPSSALVDTEVGSPTPMPMAVSTQAGSELLKKKNKGEDATENNGLDRDTVTSLVELVKYTKKNYNLFRKWDIDGLPEERT